MRLRPIVAWVLVVPFAAWAATWPSGRRLPPPVTIDHVLADRRCGVRAVSVHAIPRSDHRAVLAELALPRQSS